MYNLKLVELKISIIYIEINIITIFLYFFCFISIFSYYLFKKILVFLYLFIYYKIFNNIIFIN